MAENLVGYMRDLTRKGCTIMCVIHQPSSEVYDLFDKVLLMVDGRTAFLGGVHEAEEHFQKYCTFNL